MRPRPFVSFDVETKIIQAGTTEAGKPIFDSSPHVKGAGVVLSGIAQTHVHTPHDAETAEGLAAWHALRTKLPGHIVVGHNLAFDVGHVLRAEWEQGARWLLNPETHLWDTQTVHYLMSGCAVSLPSLEESCAGAGIEYKKDPWAENAFKQGIGADVLYREDPARLLAYLAGDLTATLRLAEWQRATIHREMPELRRTVYVQMRALKLVCICHHFGLPLDVLKLADLDKRLRGDIALQDAEISRALAALIAHPVARAQFNLDSPQQVAALLYGGDVVYDERVPVGVFKTGRRAGQPRHRITEHAVTFPPRVHGDSRSADEAALSRLARDEATPPDVRALLAPLMARRTASKILGTYCAPFMRKLAYSVDGTLHGQFHMSTTNTGRKSSSGPNLQNIPDEIREAIAAGQGRRYFVADLKQLEVVAAAYQSRDPALRAALLSGKDIHAMIKRRVDKRTGRDVKRTDVKRIVFGRIYGGGAKKLAAESGVPLDVVREIVAALDRMFPVQAKHFRTIEAALDARRQPVPSDSAVQEYAADFTLPTGRRLRFTTINGEWPYSGMKNRPIQSFATADIVPFAEMLLVGLLWENIGLVISGAVRPAALIHDENDLDVAAEHVATVRGWFARIQRQLVSALNKFYRLDPLFDLPLVIECGAGGSWLEAKQDDAKID